MEIVTENEKCRKEDSYRMYLELKRAKKKIVRTEQTSTF